MKPAVEILEEKLSKRWLSNKAVRDAMIASFIKTLQGYDQNNGKTRSEPEINKLVHNVAETIFQEMGVGFEVPTKKELVQIGQTMVERLGLLEFSGTDRPLLEEHQKVCETLLSKMDESSEDSARKP